MSYVTHLKSAEITIRAARAKDLSEIERIAARDSKNLPSGPLLVAQVSGDLRAAISLEDGRVVADPFHRTAELVEMLRIRAEGASDVHRPPAPLRRYGRRALAAVRLA
jgi:hypothetical protein